MFIPGAREFGEHLRILPTPEKERRGGETESRSKTILFSSLSLCLLSLFIVVLYFFPFSLNLSPKENVPCIECYIVGKTELEN